MTYVYKKDDIPTFVELPVDRVKEIIDLNKKGVKPENLADASVKESEVQLPDYENVVGQESLTRFDKKKKKQKNFNNNQNGGQNNAQPQNQPKQNQPRPNQPRQHNNNNNNQGRQQQQAHHGQQRNGNQNRTPQNRDRNNSNNNRQPNQQNDGKTQAQYWNTFEYLFDGICVMQF